MAMRCKERAMAIDTVTLNIIHNALTNIASEMALVMLKTSYSTIFNEGLDFTTVLLDRHGDLIAEKNYTPSMMGAIPHTVKWAVEEKGIAHFHPGDVLVHNDCYRGGCHLPEHMMMRPMFVGEHLFGFAGNIGHGNRRPHLLGRQQLRRGIRRPRKCRRGRLEIWYGLWTEWSRCWRLKIWRGFWALRDCRGRVALWRRLRLERGCDRRIPVRRRGHAPISHRRRLGDLLERGRGRDQPYDGVCLS